MTSRAREHEQFRWTPEIVSQAADLWNGGHSASEIAAIIGGGVSRSAIIGKANRLRELFMQKKPGGNISVRRKATVRRPANGNARPLISTGWNNSAFGRVADPLPVSGETVEDMVQQWIAANGEPRRFPRGFSGDWLAIRNKMQDLGWDLKMSGSWYSMLPVGSKAKPERLTRDAILAKIDAVLIANGMTPFLRREMKEAAE